MIIIGHGRLDAPDRGKPVADLLAAYEPDLRQGLASQQIQLGGAKGPAKRVRLRDVPGVMMSLSGRTANGQPLTLWLAGLEFSWSTSEGGDFFGTTYRFGADGSVLRKMLASGPVGLGSVGGDAGDRGTYEVIGDMIYLCFRDGQETARFETAPGGGVRAILFGSKRYAAR